MDKAPLFESFKLIFLNSFFFFSFLFAFIIVLIYFLNNHNYLKRERLIWKIFTTLILAFALLFFPLTGCIAGIFYGVHKESKKYSDTLVKPFLKKLYPVFLEYSSEKLKNYESLSLKDTIQKLETSNLNQIQDFQEKFFNQKLKEYFQFLSYQSLENKLFIKILETIIVYQAMEMGISKEQIYITKELIQSILTQKNNPKLFELIFNQIFQFWDSLFYASYFKFSIFLLAILGILILDCLVYKNRKYLFDLD